MKHKIITLVLMLAGTGLMLIIREATLADYKPLIQRISALEKENAAQWKRISDLEKMFCNPELIDCGK